MGIFNFLKKKDTAQTLQEQEELILADEELSEDSWEESEEEPEEEEIPQIEQALVEEESVLVLVSASEPEPEQADVAPELEPPTEKGFFQKLFTGLGKTRKNIMENVNNVLKAFTKIDEEIYEELEESLIMADIGVETSTRIIELLRERVKQQKINEVEALKQALADVIADILKQGNYQEHDPLLQSPTVLLVVGVNGVGKTTTIGKLTAIYKEQGKKVLLAAADTFRAAAIDQLEVWAQRNTVDIIKHQENSDPAAVVFDAISSAKAKKADLLICDTAGRLHNKKNLMEELRKIFKVISREYPEAAREVFLVLDATTGQNALQQAKLFKEVCDITGIVLTKLDGTAKGGIVISIISELQVPVRFIGVGETIRDMQPFDPDAFARALFDTE